MAAAPAPEQTSLTSPIRLPTTSSALSRAAAATIAVPCWSSWKTGIFIALAQPGLDLEALGRLDVLEIDAAEGGLERGDGLDQLVRVGLVDLDVEHVDPGELLEQAALALHHRLAGDRADIAEAQHGGAVGDHRHQIALGGVVVGLQRILLDLQAGHRDARAVGQRQIALVAHPLGRRDRRSSPASDSGDSRSAACASCVVHGLPSRSSCRQLPGAMPRPTGIVTVHQSGRHRPSA